MHRRKSFVIAAMLAVASLSFASAPVSAAYAHGTAVGTEDNLGSGYTGLQMVRYIQNVTAASCWPIYDTEWVWTDKPAGNWIEMNTDYRCASGGGREVVSLVGYGMHNVGWVELGEFYNGTAPGSHTFITKQNNDNYNWSYVIDTVKVWNGFHLEDKHANRLDVLLESWDNAHVVPSHHQSQLQFRRYAGVWTDWVGQDEQNNPAAPMCGFFNSDTSWQEGENVTC